MKASDIAVWLCVALVLGLFGLVPGVFEAFNDFSRDHDFLMSFIKFGVLCTFGEALALRITAKTYNRSGFGLLPRFLMWGIIGMVINASFIIYAMGVPHLVAALGLPLPPDALAGDSLAQKAGMAFCVSVANNFLFAPLFMTVQAVLSMHIAETGGTLAGFFSTVHISRSLGKIDWNMLWGFVFKKTLPFFWVPCHTITFILPTEMRVLFAAALGVVLGIILAIASLKSEQQTAMA
ncbi:hypothetical protein [Solidesulfovibrio sp. C21]|uniref:hypothetical protein n=1 Tax=Solidesulfovibrio sp. C21 TaxID=3398613 RepID=UPI0039FCE6DD